MADELISPITTNELRLILPKLSQLIDEMNKRPAPYSMTVAQAAEHTGMSEALLRSAIRSGRLAACEVGGRALLRVADLHAFIDRGRHIRTPEAPQRVELRGRPRKMTTQEKQEPQEREAVNE